MLEDVYEKFRNNSLKNYGLYASHYMSEPALSWNAWFNMTKVEIELIMCFLFKEGMRGGVSYIYKRYSKANNKILNLMTQNKNKNRWYA